MASLFIIDQIKTNSQSPLWLSILPHGEPDSAKGNHSKKNIIQKARVLRKSHSGLPRLGRVHDRHLHGEVCTHFGGVGPRHGHELAILQEWWGGGVPYMFFVRPSYETSPYLKI